MNASETAHFATEVADPMTKTVICASVYRRRVEKKQAEGRNRQKAETGKRRQQSLQCAQFEREALPPLFVADQAN